MQNVRLSSWGSNGDQKAAKRNNELGWSMVGVKCDFRL